MFGFDVGVLVCGFFLVDLCLRSVFIMLLGRVLVNSIWVFRSIFSKLFCY